MNSNHVPERRAMSTGTAAHGLLRYNPKSFLKLILIGFTLVALPLIAALVYSAISIDRLADKSRKAVYQAAQIAHGSRVLVDEIVAMERSVRQTYILNDASLLEGYFRAHAKFENMAGSLSRLSLRSEHKPLLDQLIVSESAIFQQISAVRRLPLGLRNLTDDFVPLQDLAQTFSSAGYILIEREVDAMQAMAERARTIMGWQLLALIPFAIVLALFFSVLIARPIRQIDEAIRTMGQGELSRTVTVTGPEDLRYLGEQLDWMRLRLLEVEQQKTRFLRHVSHELKTPLAAIREGADLLAEGVVGELTGKQRQIANILHGSSLQLQKRIEDLLNYSALQTDTFALQKESVALARILKEVVQEHALAALNKNLRIELDCQDVMLLCDEKKVKIIVDNLLSNAVKFSPQASQIRITALLHQNLAQVDVMDQGPGIDAADQEKVFDPFYQGRRISESHIRGTGLGLSIAREYARAHGGALELVAHGESGAHFRLTLPVNEPENIHV